MKIAGSVVNFVYKLTTEPAMISRFLQIRPILRKKSCFLFGPRQTGKTSLAQDELRDVMQLSLLDNRVFLQLSQDPTALRELVPENAPMVVIDEVQRLPTLLDEIHFMTETRSVKFLLTGSSTRKLKGAHVNMLGGRARSRTLHPFSAWELREKFDLIRALNFGLIPSIYLSGDPVDDLRSYAGDYLRTEIAAEGLVRNLNAFSRFLEIAAACNGSLINYSSISNDAAVPRTTVMEYFRILIDTLIGTEVRPWKKTTKRKAIGTSKFYFFDSGVARTLRQGPIINSSDPDIGKPFEHWVYHELKSYQDYTAQSDVNFWRSTSGVEVDFVVGDFLAVEVKAKRRVDDGDLKGLRALRDECTFRHSIVVCREDRVRRTADGILILPWSDFVERLWSGALS